MTNSKIVRLAAALAAFSLCLPTAAGYFANKQISIIRAPDGRPCTFFVLEGVEPADPATPNTSWMALPQSHVAYKENLSLLLSAKLTGRAVHVTTSGVVVPECGHVGVNVVELP